MHTINVFMTKKEKSKGSNEPRIKANIGLSNENKKCQKLSVMPESWNKIYRQL